MSEVALASLRELAGPELYRRNAFRTTGLPVDVDRRTARRRQQQLTAALRVGADLDLRGASAAPEEVQTAFDAVLGDPRRRLVHEIFAEWGAPDGCECPAGLHHDHDAAVRAHAAALEIEPADLLSATMSGAVPGQWSAAATGWAKTLRSASFWRHLLHRVERLDDKQLDASTVDLLRDELPVALVRPLLHHIGSAAYPAPLRKNLSEWPVPARERDRLIEEAAEPLYTELESLVRELHTELESGDAEGTVAAMRERVKPVLARLEGLAPRDQHRRTAAARDKVAVLLNNCALARYRETGRYEGKVRGWLAEAEKLATDPETQRRVRENLKGFEEAERELNEFRYMVDEMRRVRGKYEAARFLRGVLSQVTDEALAEAIRDMLAELQSGGPVEYDSSKRPVRPGPRISLSVLDEYERRQRRNRVLAALAVCVVLVLAYVIYQGISDGPDVRRVDVHQRHRGGNPPPVACVADADDWRDGDTEVAIVDCAEKHWGEVIAYTALIAPQTHPGEDQVMALARFECRLELIQFGLSEDTYMAEAMYIPGAANWSQEPYGNYATCAIRRIDNARWEGQATPGSGSRGPVAVQAPLTSRDGIRYNAPVDMCVELNQATNEPVEDWPIVRCTQPHWAQIIGYAEMGGSLTSTEAVEAEAVAACQRLGRRIPAQYKVSAVWPTWWHDARGSMVYAACLAHRADHQPFRGGI